MKLLPSIPGKILVYEVGISNETVSIKKSVASYSLKKSAVIIRDLNNEQINHFKKKKCAVILIVTGSDIGSKVYDSSGNEAISKITENDKLLWTIHRDDGYERIDFTRKALIDDILNEINEKGFYILSTTVSAQTDVDINIILRDFYEKSVSFNFIKESEEFMAFFFESLYDKIKLPVLLFFFVLLFVNYLIFSKIKEEYDISKDAYNIQLKMNKQETENREKASRLFSNYEKIHTYPLALLSDRIASYLPKNVLLTSMFFFPDKTPDVIIVKGKAEVAGTALLFAQYLQKDKLFGKVDVININNLKDSDSYDFELHITP